MGPPLFGFLLPSRQRFLVSISSSEAALCSRRDSFAQAAVTIFWEIVLATPAGFEPATTCLEGRCSIQLSYASVIKNLKSGWQDSNLRPPGPKPGAMTGLRYTPKVLRRVRDSNPWYSFPYACLANMSFRPLRQLSNANKNLSF